MKTAPNNIVSLLLVISGLMNSALGAEISDSEFKVEEVMEIGKVPAGFPVNFCLLTTREIQYVGYFDAHNNMTVASRALDSDDWQYQTLPTKIDWDSHNYITMAVDDDDHLHVSGNMHCVPLIYFRTDRPGDISTLTRHSMTGENEERCTYPKFMRDANNRLVFHYRDGGSGDGNQIYNVYDLEIQSWSRLLDQPLADGEGKMNAYMHGPVSGPDNWFHLVWVWRDTPDCATNHHLSHARSKDLIHWESIFGDKVELPLRLGDKSLWVDPVPSRGGLINGGNMLSFDSSGIPIIAYHKADADGNMQIYAARPEDGDWKIHQLTDWSKPVNFSGNGSMGFVGIRIGGLSQVEPGILSMTYHHRDYGSGRLVVDEKSLRPLDRMIAVMPTYPTELDKVESDFKGMSIRRTGDIGDHHDGSANYILQWETLEANYDRPRQPPLPEPSTLKLYKLTPR